MREERQRLMGGVDIAAEPLGKIAMALERVDARRERAEPILAVRAGQGDCGFEPRTRRLPHRIRCKRRDAPQRAHRGVTASPGGANAQHVPHVERERIFQGGCERGP